MKFIKILKKYEIFLCQMKYFNTYKKNDECMIIIKEFEIYSKYFRFRFN